MLVENDEPLFDLPCSDEPHARQVAPVWNQDTQRGEFDFTEE